MGRRALVLTRARAGGLNPCPPKAQPVAPLGASRTVVAVIRPDESFVPLATMHSPCAMSANVAAERYRAGVGNIIDLLTAEAALETARAQEVQARADWFVSVAQLAHDTGSLTK